ncbi:MAG: ligand-binding sensor domain-containing protein [Oceanihabitans sp.]
MNLYKRKCILILLITLASSCKKIVTKNSQKKNTNTIETKNELKPPFSIFSETKHATLNGMVSEFVWQIHQDKKGNYWFGTNHDGIILYNNNSLLQYTPEDGIGGNAVRVIIEDALENIWFGTSNGLTKYDGKKFTNYTTKDGLVANEIWDIVIDKKGTLWIGTVGGVSTFDGNNFETFEVPKPKVSNPEPMLSKNRVSAILIDKNEHFWFVNDGYGITKYNGSSFKFFTTKNGLTDNNVADLLEDSKGNIWIGTFYGGLSKLNRSTFTNFTQTGIINGIETYNLFEDKKGNIWFSAENYGVYCYNGKKFTQFTMQDGLATNTIQAIYEDKKEQIWFSTWSGISLYNGKEISNVADKEPWTK